MNSCWIALEKWFTLVSKKYKDSRYIEFWKYSITHGYDNYAIVNYFSWFPENSITDYVIGKNMELYEYDLLYKTLTDTL